MPTRSKGPNKKTPRVRGVTSSIGTPDYVDNQSELRKPYGDRDFRKNANPVRSPCSIARCKSGAPPRVCIASAVSVPIDAHTAHRVSFSLTRADLLSGRHQRLPARHLLSRLAAAANQMILGHAVPGESKLVDSRYVSRPAFGLPLECLIQYLYGRRAMHDQVPEHRELIPAGGWDFFCDAEYQERLVDEVMIRPPASYRQAFGDEPIRVGIVEFRIMHLLASRPYYAFTRHHISDAVHTKSHPLSEESVDAYVASLRDQLGVFHDFVQSVPFVGYRFKA
jgi:hypothetical protein